MKTIRLGAGGAHGSRVRDMTGRWLVSVSISAQFRGTKVNNPALSGFDGAGGEGS